MSESKSSPPPHSLHVVAAAKNPPAGPPVEAPGKRTPFAVKALIFTWAFINRFAFLMVIVSCSDIAHFFQQDRLLSLYHGCLVAFSFGAKLVHAKYLLRVPHKIKLFVITCLAILGCLCMVSAVLSVSFHLSLAATVLIGMCFAVSESIVQGFVKAFDPALIGPFGSGTGLTGIVVSSGYLALKLYSVDLMYAFAALVPFIAANQLVFSKIVDFQTAGARVAATPADEIEEGQAAVNHNLSLANVWQVLRMLRYYSTVFFLYHVFIYGVFGVFAVEATRQQTDYPRFLLYGYSVMIVLYRLASFLSRSSLALVQVARLHLPLFGLLVTYMLFVSFAEGFVVHPALMCGTIFFTGLFEGLIYVNTIYQILNDPAIPVAFKEAALNVNNLFFDLGVIASTVIGLLYMQTR